MQHAAAKVFRGESTSSIWSAWRSTSSGTRSGTRIPVICSTTSARLWTCCTLTVVRHVIFAMSSSKTSCQRLSLRPDTGSCCGQVRRRALVRGDGPGSHRGPSPRSVLPGRGRFWRDDFEAVELLFGLWAVVSGDEADHHVETAGGAATAFIEHRIGLADAGGHAEVHAKTPSGGCRFVLISRRVGVGVAGWPHRPVEGRAGSADSRLPVGPDRAATRPVTLTADADFSDPDVGSARKSRSSWHVTSSRMHR